MRIAGTDIPDEKRVEVSLTYILGIGKSKSQQIIKELRINPDKRTKDLSQDEIDALRETIDKKLKVEGDLRSEVTQNIKRLKEIGTYRGTRHSRNLPARGQRTKTNARTKRGKRMTVGSGRKPAAEKT